MSTTLALTRPATLSTFSPNLAGDEKRSMHTRPAIAGVVRIINQSRKTLFESIKNALDEWGRREGDRLIRQYRHLIHRPEGQSNDFT